MKRQQDSLWKYVRHLLAVVVLSALAMGIYSGTYDHPFAFDDRNAITENWGLHINELSFSKAWEEAKNSRPDSRRALAFASFAINHYYGKLDPYGYHLVNNIIHAINGVLVYFFALLTFRQLAEGTSKASKGQRVVKSDLSPWMALFAAGLFVAHPIQTQAVTYIVQRMTSMATMFYLVALLLYILGRRQPWGPLRITLWSAVAVAFYLAWSSKRIVFPLLFVIPLYEWFFFQNLSIAWLKRRDVQIAAGVAILAAVVFAVGAMAQAGDDGSWDPMKRLTAGYAQRDFTMAERLYTQPRVVMQYLSLIAFSLPNRLCLLHEVETSKSLVSPPTSLLSLLAIVGMIGTAIWFARRQRLLSFAVIWFLIHLVVESTFLPLEMVYEHRIYLPLVGLVLGVAYLLWTLMARQVLWAAIISCTLVALLSAATIERNTDWADIYADTITKYPGSIRARLGRGLGYIKSFEATRDATKQQDYLRKAAEDFAVVIDRKPDALNSRPGVEPKKFDTHVLDAYVAHAEVSGILGEAEEKVLAEYAKVESIDPTFEKIYVSRGNFLARRQQPEAAIPQYTKALEVKLANLKKSKGDDAQLGSTAAEAYLNRGVCHLTKNDTMKALADFDTAIRLDPNDLRPRQYRGQCFLRLDNPTAAIEDFDYVIKRNNNDTQAHFLRAQAASRLGRFREAELGYRGILKRDPRHVGAGVELVKVLALADNRSVRRPKEALAIATRLVELTKRKQHVCLSALAIAQASNGQFAEAIATQDEAIALAPPQFIEAYQRQRSLYEAERRRLQR